MSALGELRRVRGGSAEPAGKRDNKAAYLFLTPWLVGLVRRRPEGVGHRREGQRRARPVRHGDEHRRVRHLVEHPATLGDPAEAALFTDFLVNNAGAAKILLTDRGVPANTRMREAIKPELKGPDAAAATYLDEITVGEPPRVTPNGASNIEAILKRHTENVLFGRATPQDAAASFIKELQSEIDAA